MTLLNPLKDKENTKRIKKTLMKIFLLLKKHTSFSCSLYSEKLNKYK